MDYDAGSQLGAWQHITPEEVIHAYILSMARDASGPGNRAKMKNWRYHALTVTFRFAIAVGEDVYWRQACPREEIKFKVTTRTAQKRTFEINMVFKSRGEVAAMRQNKLAKL